MADEAAGGGGGADLGGEAFGASDPYSDAVSGAHALARTPLAARQRAMFALPRAELQRRLRAAR
jgi:hypothetical protein